MGTQSSGYLDTTATPGQQYWYWVMAAASSSSSTSAWSAVDLGYRKLATVPGVTASYDEYSDRIALAWTDVVGETGYGIWVNAVNDSGTASYLAGVGASATSYSDTAATPGVEYFYWILATNSTSASTGDFQANGALGRRLDPNLPIVMTDTPTDLTAGGANGGGNVVNEGASEVTARGVVWSTSQNPTTADGQDAHAEGGPGAFTNYISGLVAGQTYYVRAYASNTAGVVYGDQKSFATPCFSGVVTGLHANPTNGLDFTARWSALAGAASYRLDVSTNQYFMEGSSVAGVISESFAGFTATNGSTDRSGALNSYMETTGWTGAAVYENVGEAKMGASSTIGSLTTPALDLSANGGQAVFTFKARKYGTDSPTIYVAVSSDGVNYVQSGASIALVNDMLTYTNLITNGTASCRVRIAATVASKKRYYLDDWRIEQGSGEPSFLPGYSNLTVAGTSQIVTDLATNSWYYFRVRAEGAGACISDNSATLPVQTRDLAPQGPDNVQASDGSSLNHVHVTWTDVALAESFVIYRNTLDEFDTATAIATNFRAGNVLLDEDFVDLPDWTNGGTDSHGTVGHYGAATPCRDLGIDDTLTSPPINYPTQMTFYVDATAGGNGKTTTNYYSLDGGATWLPIGSFITTTNGATVTQALTNSPDLSQSTNVLFRFVSAFDRWYLDDVKVTGGSVTNFFDVGTLPGDLWWYFVMATNSYGANAGPGDSGWRGLAAVTGVAATDGTSTEEVTVSWNDLGGGETGYAVWRAETSSSGDAVCVGAAGADGTSYGDEGAVPGQQYWYWVRATNSSSEGMGDWGAFDPGYRKLAIVADLAASYNGYDDRIQITWTDSEGETAYALWRNTADNSGTATFLMEISANETSYGDYSAGISTDYYYWLRATNDTSETQSDFQAGGALGRRAQTPPVVTTLPISNNVLHSAMSGGEVLDVGGSAITNRGVVWNTTGDPTIADSHTADGPGAGLGTYASTIAPTIGGVTYYVRAYAQNAERIAYGQVVAFVAECMEDLPATLAADNIAATTFQANWKDVDGAESYRLDVSTNATFLGGYDANVAALHNGVLGEGTGGVWIETNVLQSAGYVALRTNTSALVTPAIDFNAGSGEALSFRARIFGGGGNGDFRNKITVSISTDDGATWENVGIRTPMNAVLTAMDPPFDLSTYAGTQVKVRLQTLSASAGVGVGVVDVAVTNLLDPRGDFIAGYSNRTANGTSLVVTGLMPEEIYYYRVRAYASETCTSGNSDTRPVTTLAYESTWDAGGANNRNWTTAANWVGDELPRTNATVFFYSAINGSSPMIDLNGNQTVKGLRFLDGAAANATLRSNLLAIGAGGIGVGAGAAGNLAILSDLTVAVDQTWTNAAIPDFTIAGAVSGAGAVTKRGTGRIVLTGNDSTFTGALAINDGALQIRGTNALGATSAGTVVADGAALELHGGGSAVNFAIEPLTLSGTGVSGGGALRFVQNNVTFRGPIALAGDALIQVASNSPVASGAIAIGANTLTVDVTTDATELRLGGNLSGTRTDGAGAFVKDGPSRLILTGNNLGLTGLVTLEAGEIRLGSAHAIGPSPTPLVFANNVVMKSVSVADYDISRPLLIKGDVAFGEAATRTGTLRFGGDVDLDGATRTIAVSNPVTKWVEFAGDLSNGNLTKAGPGLMILSGTTPAGVGLAVSAGSLEGDTDSLIGNIVNNGLVIFRQDADGTYAGNMSGYGSLEKNGSGRLTITGTSPYDGITMINEGTVVMNGSAPRSAHVVGSGRDADGHRHRRRPGGRRPSGARIVAGHSDGLERRLFGRRRPAVRDHPKHRHARHALGSDRGHGRHHRGFHGADALHGAGGRHPDGIRRRHGLVVADRRRRRGRGQRLRPQQVRHGHDGLHAQHGRRRFRRGGTQRGSLSGVPDSGHRGVERERHDHRQRRQHAVAGRWHALRGRFGRERRGAHVLRDQYGGDRPDAGGCRHRRSERQRFHRGDHQRVDGRPGRSDGVHDRLCPWGSARFVGHGVAGQQHCRQFALHLRAGGHRPDQRANEPGRAKRRL